MTTAPPAVQPRPPFWFRLSVNIGNLVQIVGLILGFALLYFDARLQAADVVRVVLMIVAAFAIYVCSHSWVHYLVGRSVGIRFRGYGMRGTDHPQDYPPGMRQLTSRLPTFTAITQKDSLQSASPLARAIMFAAGETSTTICAIFAGWYAWSRGLPGGAALFIFFVIFCLIAVIANIVSPNGDYWKALRALRADIP